MMKSIPIFKKSLIRKTILLISLTFVVLAISRIGVAGPIFAVSGTVKQADDSLAATGLIVTVRNTTRNLLATTTLGDIVQGQYTVTFVSLAGSVAEIGDTLEIKIADPGGGLIVEATHTVTTADISNGITIVDIRVQPEVVQVSPSLSTVRIEPSAVTADGINAATVTVALRDARNIPIQGNTVQIDATGADNEISPVTPTDVRGETTVQIRSTKAEEKTVAVTVGTVALTPQTVTFIAGAVSPTLSTVVPPELPIRADGLAQAEIRIALRDEHGNPVIGKPIGISGSGSDNSITFAADVTDANGEIVAMLASTKAEVKRVAVRDSSSGVVLIQQPQVSFVPGPVSLTRSEISAESPALADGEVTSLVTVTLLDEHGNPIQGEAVTISVSGSNNAITQPTFPTDADGQTTATVASTRAEVKTVTANVGFFPLIKTAAVKFVAVLPDIVVAAVTPYSLPADGTSTATIGVAIIDTFGNRITEIEPILLATDGVISETKLEPIESLWTATYTAGKRPGVVVLNVLIDGTVMANTIITLTESETPTERIESVSVSQGVAKTGDLLIFQLLGEHGRTASLSVEGVPSMTDLPLHETSPGVYTGTYVVQRGDGVSDGVVVFQLGESVDATQRITINAVLPGGLIPTTLILSLPSQEVSFMEGIAIQGVLTAIIDPLPDLGDLTVVVNYRSPVGSIHTVEAVTDANGNYQQPEGYVLDAVGDWEVEVQWEGNDQFGPSSASQTFTVASGAPVIQLTSKTQTALGATLTVGGQLIPAIAGAVRIDLDLPDGQRLTRTDTTTDDSGHFEWEQTFDLPGAWLITTTYAGDERYQPVSQSIVILVTREIGKAILVLGGGDSQTNTAWESFNNLAQSIHRTFVDRNLDADKDILFLSPEPEVTPNADDLTSAANLESAIAMWAAQQVNPQLPLFLYLLSPNLEPPFLINPEVSLTPEMLDGWLDLLPQATPVFIFIEAGYSGNFITRQIDGVPVLPAANRTVITSTRGSQQAHILPNQSSFSKAFFDRIDANEAVRDAFIGAQALMQRIPAHRSQFPMIDANGNGVGNEAEDLAAVVERYLPTNLVSTSSPPSSIHLSRAHTLPAGTTSVTVEAEVSGIAIMKVIGTVVPPTFNPHQTIDRWDALTFDQFLLIRLDSSETGSRATYRGIYDQLSAPGEYAILIHAEDADGVFSKLQSPITIKLKAPLDPSQPNVILDFCRTVAPPDAMCDVPPIEKGSVFDVWMNVRDIADLTGFDAEIIFPPQILEAIALSEADFLKQNSASTFSAAQEVDNINGTISISVIRLTGGGISGSGVLARVQFRAREAGTGTIAFDNANLVSALAAPIPVNLIDAQIKINGIFPAWDINQDGQVDIFDLVLVGKQLDQQGENLSADLNGDGVINIFDIVIVGNHFGESGITAASAVRMVEEQDVILTHKSLFRRLQQELGWIPNPTSEVTTVQRLVNQLLRYAEPTVDETQLLQNYPNPFNPETWIPYQLAEPGAVSITIYNLHGEIVRQLKLGQRETGTYFSGQRAAYWDGRNEHGDRVASGVYLYHLRVDGAVDIEATKRLVILK